MDTKLERLIDQCKSPGMHFPRCIVQFQVLNGFIQDSDVKIDALAKLQLEFESGTTRASSRSKPVLALILTSFNRLMTRIH